jgi:hypothetical protein
LSKKDDPKNACGCLKLSSTSDKSGISATRTATVRTIGRTFDPAEDDTD